MFGNKKSEMSETEKQAKMNVLKKIKAEMEDAMKSGLGNSVKKVTVAADSEEGLEEGLDKAKEIIEDSEENEDEESSHHLEEESEEEYEMSDDDSEELEDEESIDAEIERLLAKKKELQSL